MSDLDSGIVLAERGRSMGRDVEALLVAMRALPAGLLRAYCDTRYRILRNDEPVTLRLLEDPPMGIAELLNEHRAQSWAFITACNPYSEALSEEANAQRHALLLQLLTAQSLTCYPAVGVAESGDWREQSVFVPGISYAMARAVGTVFQQHAVLFGESGGPVELVFCER